MRARGLLATLLAIVGLVALVGCGDDDGGGGTVEGGDGAFTIELPDGWTTAEDAKSDEIADDASEQLDDLGVDGSSLDFGDVYFRGDDEVGTNVNVITEPLPEGVGFEDAVDTGVGLIESTLPGAEILSGPDPTTVDGDEAFAVEYQALQGDVTLKFSQVYVSHEDTVYSITLTTSTDDEDDEDDEAEAEFDEILDSWSWE